MGLTVFVVLVVLAAGAEAMLPRRPRAAPERAERPFGEDLAFALRSGLAPIRGYAEILGDRLSGDADQRMIRAIEHHADRLTVLADRATSCSSCAASP